MTQIDYTSRDFNALKSDLINLISTATGTQWNPTDYSDLGNVLVETFAYMGDVMSHYLDRAANETSIQTAIQTQSLLNLATLYDYHPSGPVPATVNVTFTNTSTNTITLPVGTQVIAPLTYGPYSLAYFETTQAATAVQPGAQAIVTTVEGKTVNTDRPDLIDSTYNQALPLSLGTSDGSANQSYTIIDFGVIDSSIYVYVGQGVAFNTWTYLDNLLEAGPKDTVFTTIRNSDGTINIQFGDGVNGAVPLSGQLISSLYKNSVGSSGNVLAGAIAEISFVPGNVDPQVSTYFTVTNSVAASGGADGDSLTQIKTKVQASMRSRNRAVTLADYGNIAIKAFGVGKAAATANVFTSVNLYVQPISAGSTSPTPGLPLAVITDVGTSGSGGTGTVVSYTTKYAHNFATGDLVNISGIRPYTYNLQGQAITVTGANTFTIASAVTGTLTTGGLDPFVSGTVVNLTPTSAWGSVSGTSLSNSLKSTVASYMSDKIMLGTTLTVLPPVYVPIYLTLTVKVNPAYKNSDVVLGIYQAVLGTGGLFEYNNNNFGASIPVSQLISTLQAVNGVVSVVPTQFSTDGSTPSAGVLPSDLSLAANQIPFLTATNLVINASGGITS